MMIATFFAMRRLLAKTVGAYSGFHTHQANNIDKPDFPVRIVCVGAFKIGCKVENIADRDQSATVKNVLVDTGSEYTWLPEQTLKKINIAVEKKDVPFIMANGQTITRSIGFALLRVGSAYTVDEVVFAQRGDSTLLGARTLDGLNLVVNNRDKKLAAAGPIVVA